MSNPSNSVSNPSNSVLDSFLTPEAMLTPGVAGALTMMITNALGVSFATPRAWTALLLSFLFGLLVLVANKDFLTKGVFYVLNSLVIFCVANGANGVGAASRNAALNLAGPAWAQTVSVASNDLQSTYKNLSDQYDDLSKKIEAAKNTSASKDDVLALVAKRDDVGKKRDEVLAQIIEAKAGVTIKDIKAPSSDVNKIIRIPFFEQWRF